MDFNIAQLIGLLASAIIIFAFGHKQDKYFLSIAGIGCFIFTVHFFMLEAYAGAAVNAINGLCAYGSIFFHRSKFMMAFFFLLYGICGVFTIKVWVDALPIVSGFIGVYTVFQLKGLSLRLIMLGTSLMWMIYNIIFMSYGGIITELFVMSSNCLTIFRIWKDEKKDQA